MDLIKKIQELKQTQVEETIKQRVEEFKSFNKESYEDLFKELSFCLMTANFNAKRAIEIQKVIGKGFLTLSLEELRAKLKILGHRFPNMRAKFIYEARNHEIKEIISNLKGNELRDWFFKNIKGLGMKESSHFLRNIGFLDYAILDFHIIDILVEHDYIEKPKTLSKKKYIEIEKTLNQICKELNIRQGELDLYLWYLETNTVLK